MKPLRSYTCEACGGTFRHGRSDEDVRNESLETWGPIPKADRVLVCEDCYATILAVQGERMTA